MFVIYQSKVVNLNNVFEFKIHSATYPVIGVSEHQDEDFVFPEVESAKFVFQKLWVATYSGCSHFSCDYYLKEFNKTKLLEGDDGVHPNCPVCGFNGCICKYENIKKV